MARSANVNPTDGELELLQILWRAGPVGLGEICRSMRRRRPVAATTVATMLKVMLDKKLVHRRRGPQGYLWSAKTTRKRAASGMIRKLVDSVFDGSAGRLVAHLMESDELSDEERSELQRLIQPK
ncbi:MAG: BlaI/MecI/CopY family transcriptional regulator [Thermoguttaceae bacterium]